MSSDSPSPSRWEKGATRLLATTRVFDVRGVDFRHPVRGTQREFVVIDAPDWVNVIALTPDHRLVMVNQFRYGIDSFSWEIPGGVIERGEDPVVAGVRELQEETGYAGKPARLLGTVNPNPAIMNNRCHLVLVEDAVVTSALAWDHDEEIEMKAVPVDEVYEWARSGRITHSLVLNALLLFEPRWAEIKRG
ncbi:MAG: NUDIX hydrolase [Opitutaceae bacterium]|jgi:8-oxo-dGTP pyrophosphatase MutT (NUDIX family)